MADSKQKLRNFVFKALKATIKGVLFYVAYFLIWSFVSPITQVVPSIQQTVEIFVAVYIVLIIVGEFTSGTIYQHFFGAAKALFVIGYLILSLKGGIFEASYQNVDLMVDIRLFLTVAILLSLLGLSKSVLQAINYINEKAEYSQNQLLQSIAKTSKESK